MKFLLKTFAQI